MIVTNWRVIHAFVAICCLLPLTGCTLFDPMYGLSPEEQVRIRAQAWADALRARDLHEAYSYTSPSYRQFATAGRYHARVAGTHRWKSATVRDVECVEAACEVTLILEYQAHQSDFDIRRPRTYTWVESEGAWWLYVPLK